MPEPDHAETVLRLVGAEIAGFDTTLPADAALLAEFRAMQVKRPRPITVTFPGGLMQTCWSVTRSDGAYSVLYLPRAGYFTLCVDSDFGPLDFGVHGPALGCFGSV